MSRDMSSGRQNMADSSASYVILAPIHNIQWSVYANNLSPNERQRYKQKLGYSNGTRSLPDPYNLKTGWQEDPSYWPDVTFGDVYIYLINTPGRFTNETLKAYKSLQAYDYVISGHVHKVMYHTIDNNCPFCILKTNVTPSQRLQSDSHEPWAIVDKERGSVYCAHCTCMAGLGEVCSHVAALLFKVELGVRGGLNKTSCTSEACAWNATFRKELNLTTINEAQLQFSNRRKPVDTVNACGKGPLPDIATLKSLKSVCPDAVFFTTIPPLDSEETETASEEEDRQSYPPLLTSMTHEDVETNELDATCKKLWSNYKCTTLQISNLERKTRFQNVCPLWFEHRKGRITGTKAHQVLIRRDSTNPSNLVKSIMGYHTRDLSKNNAVSWGIDNEQRARDEYTKQQTLLHKNFKCESTGLLICKTKPFLGVSSDGIISCDCCGNGVLEIKCPFKHKDTHINTAALDPTFCLDDNMQLKPKHKYYTQIQLQMYCHNVLYCDFVVFTNLDLCVITVVRDDEFCDNLIAKCENFFHNHVIQEIVSRKLETAQPNALNEDDESNATVWCFCREKEYGKMITCEGDNCPYKWFHYKCVDIRRKPRKPWFCASCSHQ